MNKSDLILKILESEPNLFKKDASKIVNVFFDTISEAISRGERVELRGFGVFDVKVRQARIARNPKMEKLLLFQLKKCLFLEWAKI